MGRLAFIQSICSPREEGYREFLLSPFRVQGWTVATCGKALLAWPVEDGDPTQDVPEVNLQATAKIIAAKLPEPAGVTTLAELRTWAGPNEEPCVECWGAPDVERECEHCGEIHDCQCMRCRGKTAPNPLIAVDRLGNIAGTPLNLRLLAWTLREAPNATVHVYGSRQHAREPLWLISDPWRLAIMPVQDNTGDSLRNTFPLPASLPLTLEAGSRAV